MAAASGGGGGGGSSTVQDLGLLALRLTGAFLATHGYHKIFGDGGMSKLTAGIEEMEFPVPVAWAWAAALAELVGGAFVFLGLFTRYAAFFAACTMFVAAFFRHAQDPFAKKELALVFLCAMVCLMCVGPGGFSIDRLWRKKD